MNKIIIYLKNIILASLIYLNIKYLTKFTINNYSCIIYLLLLGILIFLTIKDTITKNKINNNKTYNIITIFISLITIFIFIRAINSILPILNNYKDDYIYINQMYMNQNFIYFTILLILLLIYRYINIKKQNSKYHPLSTICFILSIISILPTEMCFERTFKNSLEYLFFTLTLLTIEIYRLIKDNHKKREWLIFVSFLFNMFALISIFVNLFLD